MGDMRVLERFTAVDPKVKQMVLALPDFRVGDDVHSIYVNKLEGSLPGRHTKFLGEGARYIDIFFPRWAAVRFTGDAAPLTGLNDGWWSDFSTAVLCQSMDNVAQDLRPQLKHQDINNAVDAANGTLNNTSARFYSRVFSDTFADFSVPFNSIDHAFAKGQYIEVLKNGVALMDLWQGGNLWKNPEWQMFHHFIKLLALGASVQEVTDLNRDLVQRGLKVPPTIEGDNWTRFSGYLQSHPRVTHEDIDAVASNGILKSEVVGGGRSYSLMKEENSYEFTSNGQPGNRYRQAPSGGSCFSDRAFVLMQDRSAKPIREVRSGDIVASPSGPRHVAYVSTPQRAGRQLYRLNDLPFAFTGSHPFMNASERGGRFLSADPSALSFWVPTHAVEGVGQLNAGALVWSAQPGVPDKTVTRVQSVALSPEKVDVVYDIVLEPDASGAFEYFAGSREQFFLVTSEIPLIEQSPLASSAIADAMLAAVPAFQRAAAGATAAQREERIQLFRRYLSSELIYRAIRSKATEPVNTAANPSRAANVAASDCMQVLSSSGYDPMIARLFETVIATSGLEIESAIRLGWRHFSESGGDTLAVSVSDILLESAAPLSPDARLQVIVSYAVEGFPAQTCGVLLDRSEAGSTPFRRSFNQVTYCLTGGENPASSRELRFEISPIDGGPKWRASAFLPAQLQPPYRRLSPRLRDERGTVIGHLMLDVRTLSAEEAQLEREDSARWNGKAEAAFAERLGQQMGKVLSDMTAAIAAEGAA